MFNGSEYLLDHKLPGNFEFAWEMQTTHFHIIGSKKGNHLVANRSGNVAELVGVQSPRYTPTLLRGELFIEPGGHSMNVTK